MFNSDQMYSTTHFEGNFMSTSYGSFLPEKGRVEGKIRI